MARPSASQFSMSKVLNDKYLLGDEIGKGAYGRVYKGVDLLNGDFVAIKQVSLENISQDDLASIMQEIDLLKVLNHRNVVKYLGSFKTKSDLYILLEFVENGSLANIVKPNKFGAFPESLAALYISQVLEGLVYLHSQGVIHRDIKGGNILTTKEGCVKLADFGVATKLTEADGNALSVVGTPYWMAPEVIEMSGVTASADIWSVGCTTVELLTCVPPYYDLQPMPALFRIVQDDSPPIPPGSAPLQDFLCHCFRKDSKQRPTAAALLHHPWIQQCTAQRKQTPSPPPSPRTQTQLTPPPVPLHLPPTLPPPPPLKPHPPLPASPAIVEKGEGSLERFRDRDEDRQVADLFPLESTEGGLHARLLRRKEAQPFSETSLQEVADLKLADREEEEFVTRRACDIHGLMADLRPARSESSLHETCGKILVLLPEAPDVRAQVLATSPCQPLADMLSVESSKVVSSVLTLINKCCEGGPRFTEKCGRSGMFPSLLHLATAERSRPEIRLQAASALKAICTASPLSLSMLLSCRPVPVLVGLVEADYSRWAEVVHLGLDCVSRLLAMGGQREEGEEVATEMASSGLLLRLLATLTAITTPQPSPARKQPHCSPASASRTRSVSVGGGEGVADRVVSLLLHLVQCGASVRAQFCTPMVTKRLMDAVATLPLPLLLPLLRCCTLLSCDPACLDPMQRADAIAVLVPHLDTPSPSVLAPVLLSLYNLQRMNKRRQEMAAEAGVVPRLLALLATPSPLNQFCYPLLCDLAHASRTTRGLLRACGAIHTFLEMLQRTDGVWAVIALDSLAVCLQHDDEGGRVEQAMLKKDAMDRLLAFFRGCTGAAFVSMLEPFLKIITKAPRLNAALGVAGLIPLLVQRLDQSDAIARVSLLKMIKSVYEHHPRPKQLLAEHDLPRKLRSLSEDRREGGQVLVKQMASTLLKGLQG